MVNAFTLFPLSAGFTISCIDAIDNPHDLKSSIVFTFFSLTIACVAAYVVHVIKHVYLVQMKIRPPGPIPMPLVGSLLMLIKRNGPDGNPRIHTGLADVAKKYDSDNKGIVGLWMGMNENDTFQNSIEKILFLHNLTEISTHPIITIRIVLRYRDHETTTRARSVRAKRKIYFRSGSDAISRWSSCSFNVHRDSRW